MENAITFVTGLLVGAGIMYVLDPERGNSRRASMRDTASNLANRATDEVSSKAREIKNRATNFAQEVGNAASHA